MCLLLCNQACARSQNVRRAWMGMMVRDACGTGSARRVQALIRASPVCVNWCGRDGFTALHWAVVRGQASIIGVLLAHDQTNVNARTPSGWTALHIACRNDLFECVRLLIESERTDVAIRSADGLTPIDIAASGGRATIVDPRTCSLLKTLSLLQIR